MFINGLFYGIMCIALIGFGFFLGNRKSEEEREEFYCRGYDHAVNDMKDFGCYYDKDNQRHTGEWIEKEEENV
jgi:hypothetical protein